MHRGDRGAFLRSEAVTYVDVPLTRFLGEKSYASRLALIVQTGWELNDAAPTTHSLEYVSFPRPFYSPRLLTNFEYWLEDNSVITETSR